MSSLCATVIFFSISQLWVNESISRIKDDIVCIVYLNWTSYPHRTREMRSFLICLLFFISASVHCRLIYWEATGITCGARTTHPTGDHQMLPMAFVLFIFFFYVWFFLFYCLSVVFLLLLPWRSYFILF